MIILYKLSDLELKVNLIKPEALPILPALGCHSLKSTKKTQRDRLPTCCQGRVIHTLRSRAISNGSSICQNRQTRQKAELLLRKLCLFTVFKNKKKTL